MATQTYRTRNHVLPLVRIRGRVAVVVAETSDWFRRSLEPHLEENAQVRIEAAEGYAYCLQPRAVTRPPVLARRVVFLWRAGQLFVESAKGTDGRPVDLNALFTASGVRQKSESRRKAEAPDDSQSMLETPRDLRTIEEAAAEVLESATEDPNLSNSGLRPNVQFELAETARQEGALRLALLARVQEADARAAALCVKLLAASFGGVAPNAELYSQAAAKFESFPYVPHLRDLLVNLITSPRPTSLRDVAKDFCRHLVTAKVEAAWAAELLNRA